MHGFFSYLFLTLEVDSLFSSPSTARSSYSASSFSARCATLRAKTIASQVCPWIYLSIYM